MSENKTPRRDFIKLATMTLGGVGAASLAIPLITSMNPGKDTLALASTEIDLSPLKEGQSLTVIWRGKQFLSNIEPRRKLLKQRILI
jgi:ubiquinol-cytochrome c reductase iron-sulfur subunit